MITVCCVMWGDKFSEEYVHKLKRAVERNTTRKHKFVCLSDRKIEGIQTKILKPGMTGWWNKIQLFDGEISGRIVYLDLDTVITSSLDWLMDYNGTFMAIEDLGVANAHQQHLKGVMQSGVMAWRGAAMDWINAEFFFTREETLSKFRGDGEWLNSIIRKRDLLQHLYPNKLKSYKYEVYPDKLDDTSIICFHGRPSVIQAQNESVTTPMKTYEPQGWIEEYWK
tara:strand:+ start:1195 stop:1866 length:672 start_codon:yes stop_codon:yes gene_type:complete